MERSLIFFSLGQNISTDPLIFKMNGELCSVCTPAAGVDYYTTTAGKTNVLGGKTTVKCGRKRSKMAGHCTVQGAKRSLPGTNEELARRSSARFDKSGDDEQFRSGERAQVLFNGKWGMGQSCNSRGSGVEDTS